MLIPESILVIAVTAARRSNEISIERGVQVAVLRDGNEVVKGALLKNAFPSTAGWLRWKKHALYVIPRQYVERYIATRQAGIGEHLYPMLSIWAFAAFIPKSGELRIGTVIAITKKNAEEAAARLLVKQGVPIRKFPFALERIPVALLYEKPATAPPEREMKKRFASYLR